MTERTLLLPWRSFYWAVVRVDSAAGAAGDAAVCEELERVLPLPLGDVEVRQLQGPNGATIACCIERLRLEDLIERHPACVAIVPAEFPAAVREAGGVAAGQSAAGASCLEPTGLNFLNGVFEPEAVTRTSRARRRTLLAAAAASLALVAAGFWSRERAASDSARETREATRAMLLGVSTAGNRGSTADLQRTLETERATLAQSRGEAGSRLRPVDAAEGLAAILAAWPQETETRASSLQVTPKQASVGVELPSTAAAEAFAAALARASGWRMLPPQTDAAGSAIRVTARLERAEGAKNGGPP